MNHNNGQKQNGNGLSPIGRAMAAATPVRETSPKPAYHADYGNHADMLGVGATWPHPDMLQKVAYATT